MSDDVLHDLKISRYDPAVEYTDSTTWTAISDIGDQFDDGVLTQREYYRAEDMYLNAFTRLLKVAGEPVLLLNATDPTEPNSYTSWLDGIGVSPDDAREVLRAMLREDFWCAMSSEDGTFSATVGFDYYMFISSAHPSVRAIKSIQRMGLYVTHHVTFPFRPDVDPA